MLEFGTFSQTKSAAMRRCRIGIRGVAAPPDSTTLK
jgi:hypothetical protein